MKGSEPIRRKPPWAAAALVGVAAVAVHGRSIGFDFTYLDDRDFIVDDHAFLARPASVLRAFARPYMDVVDGQHSYYRPLVTVSYVLDAQWSGLRAFGYHLTNVVLHAMASLLFLAWLRRVGPHLATEHSTGGDESPGWRGIPDAAALVFAVHPALASAVAWIPGRNDTLLAVFAISSLLFFLADARRPCWRYRVLHCILFCLALLTKESAMAIPLVCAGQLLVVERTALERLWRSRTLVLLIAVWVVGIGVRLLGRQLYANATVSEFIHNLPLLVTSLGQLVLPFNPSLLSVREDLPLWPGLAAAGLLAAAVRLAPGIRWQVVTLGALTFVVFLSPSLAVPGALVQSGRLYLPACGVLLAIAEVVRALAPDRGTAAAFSGATIAVLAAITIAYEGTFRDRKTFARSAVAAAPHSPLAHVCLGQSYQIDGDENLALSQYRIALTLGAIYVVHNNIAVIDMANARWSAAEQELREELAVDPRYARAYSNLGIVLRREGRSDEAQQAEERARELGAEVR